MKKKYHPGLEALEKEYAEEHAKQKAEGREGSDDEDEEHEKLTSISPGGELKSGHCYERFF